MPHSHVANMLNISNIPNVWTRLLSTNVFCSWFFTLAQFFFQISASRYCNHITMADYLTSNRHEIEKFVQQAEDGFQWKHYFQFLGVLELDMNVDAIATRTRNAIKVRSYN